MFRRIARGVGGCCAPDAHSEGATALAAFREHGGTEQADFIDAFGGDVLPRFAHGARVPQGTTSGRSTR